MHPLDYFIVFIYLVITLLIGLIPAWQKRNSVETLDEFHLGDFPWWALGASGMASNVDIAGTMVIAALVYSLGTRGFFIEIRGGIVLIMAFLMVFMGKWTRRSQVMTTAEWMRFRFGEGKEGNLARIISAISNIVFSIGAMSYFSIGGGKFIGYLMGISDRLASILLVILAAVYTVASGFSGVIWTDVFQALLILVAVVYICGLAWTKVDLPESFTVSLPNGKDFILKEWNFADWSTLLPPLKMDIPGDYAIFNLFGGVILFYLLKTAIEGCSGTGGYIAQRYFAARSELDTGLLSLFWIVSMAFRWPLITGFAVLGIHYSLTQNAPIPDAELILPIVITNYVPMGLRGLMVACFMAAAMSTFSSIINASAAYWTKDIYQAYLAPQASEANLVFQSRLASVLIVVVGLLFSFNLSNINDIWGWLSLGLGVGLAIPLLLRWYWWRFNGYGFAWGTLAGMVTAIATKILINNSQNQEYILFFVPGICALLGCLIGTYTTPETPSDVVKHFYAVTQPFGFWGKYSKGITSEHKRDILATFVAVPWQLSLFLLGVMVIMKNWENVKILALALWLLSIALYFTWFRHLKSQERGK
ncbi:Na+/proline symporter [Gloeocapsa sp. PCC 73106]|uniref:sodium:solute symporter family transporter n=1 Tax=Gloeocapsa sp. PCC 73106 TaxID=102232 RepID=UPI0002ACC392|nr:Na+/proline symporter [Gloeocapsa sp. PCC 73106]